MGNMIHPNPVRYLRNASPLHIPLSVLDHTPVKRIAWRLPKTCRPIIQNRMLQKIILAMEKSH